VHEAAGGGRLLLALPEEADPVDEPPSLVTRSPASIASGNVSERWNVHAVSTTMPITASRAMSSPPARIRCSFTAVSKYE